MRIALTSLCCLLLTNPLAEAQDLSTLPAEFEAQMSKMVGTWTFAGTEGDRRFSGSETIRLTNNGTALLQEGWFDLGGGKKEHYVILSGWDGAAKTVRVRGFTSAGYSWTGEWKQLQQGKWIGTASGKKATFAVNSDSMRYEDAGDGTAWVSNFTRVKR